MKTTRNLFILNGNAHDVNVVLSEIEFKGATTLTEPTSANTISDIFNNNKSIVCGCELADSVRNYHDAPIYIEVVNGTIPTSSFHINIDGENIATQFANIANTLNCDIGDHKSNSSGLRGAPLASDCAYCKLLRGIHPVDQHILYKSNNFFVIATVGEFIKGYLLIIPIRHIMSNAELTSLERAEFIQVLEDVRYILRLTYGIPSYLVWENGTGNSGIGKAKDSIVHAHTHIAPSNLNSNVIQKFSGIPLTHIWFEDFPKYNKNSYLLVRGNSNNDWWINNNPNIYIPRQYVRQLLAGEHNITGEMWNWRLYPFLELMKETDLDISNALKQNWNDVPDRIKTNTKDYLI